MSTTNLSGEVIAVTDQTFVEEVLHHDLPVVVDFWAEWCPSCHMISAILAEIARERAGTLSVRKLNTDENPITAANYKVLSLPTLMLFIDGRPVHALVGARPKSRILDDLDSALSR